MREIEAENHLKQLAERELGRIKSDVAKSEKTLNDLQDKLGSLQVSSILYLPP